MATLGLQGFTSADASAFAGARESMAQGMAQLGAQIRQDIAKIALNRDVKAMGQDLASVDPHSEDFAQQAIGVLSQHPLAAQTPFGSAAINQLGAQHKAWINANQKVNQVKSIPGYPGYVMNNEGVVTKLPLPDQPKKTMTIPLNSVGIRDESGNFQTFPPEIQAAQRDAVAARQSPKAAKIPVATFRDNVRYNQLQPRIQALRGIRQEIAALGLNPEASHDELVRVAGARGADLSRRRAEVQDTLTEGGKSDWSKGESFVDTYESRYVAPTLGIPYSGPTQRQGDTGLIPGLPAGGAPMGESPSLMEGGGIPDNRPSYKPGSIYKDSNGRRARFTKDGTWEPVQ